MKRIALITLALFGISHILSADEEKRTSPAIPPRLVIVDRIDQQRGEIGLRELTVRFIWGFF